MTVDLKEEHKADRIENGPVWFGDERRRHLRTEVAEVAYLSNGGASTRCQVLNISAEGAAIDVPTAAFIPDRFQLMTEKDRFVRKCRVVWIQQNRIGVAFES
jgi:PilZ domain